MVEIDRLAENALDERFTRRLIDLEMRDVEVPPSPSADLPQARTLFVRVMDQEDDSVRVELWELGQFHGARIVRGVAGATRHMLARRIALAAAALARNLRYERIREDQLRVQREQERAAAERAAAALQPEHRLALGSSLRGAAVGGVAWAMGGPALDGALRFRRGAQVRLGAAWLFGEAPQLGQAPGTRWLEVSVAPGQALDLSHRVRLDLDVEFAAAAVHLMRVRSVDGVANQRDTWTGRAGAELHLEVATGQDTRLRFGPDLGLLLRPIPVTDGAGAQRRLGGIWVGGTIGMVFDPRSKALEHAAF